jgi:hypothetical protein
MIEEHAPRIDLGQEMRTLFRAVGYFESPLCLIAGWRVSFDVLQNRLITRCGHSAQPSFPTWKLAALTGAAADAGDPVRSRSARRPTPAPSAPHRPRATTQDSFDAKELGAQVNPARLIVSFPVSPFTDVRLILRDNRD